MIGLGIYMPEFLTAPHGHVVPRKDGAKARCGGPGLCQQCADEQRYHARNAEILRPWREQQDWEWFGVAVSQQTRAGGE